MAQPKRENVMNKLWLAACLLAAGCVQPAPPPPPSGPTLPTFVKLHSTSDISLCIDNAGSSQVALAKCDGSLWGPRKIGVTERQLIWQLEPVPAPKP